MENLTVAQARELFDVAPGYLDTASLGVPPQPAWDALQEALGDWRAGRATAPGYDVWVTGARAAFARLVGVPAQHVGVGSQVSLFAGMIAASLPDGAEVVCADNEFSSILFPFLVQSGRGVRVRTVSLGGIAEAIAPETDLVSVSAVQSADGEVADLDAVVAAAHEHGAATLVDATQACGWLPLDATRFDYLVCAAYKWLLSPRGTAFMAIRPERRDALVPHAAGWYAGEEPWSSIYGPPLRLAASARRFDLSPAWLSWVGTQPALELIERVGVEAIHAHDVGLANRFRAGVGLDPSDSAIVSAEVAGAGERLDSTGIRASVRQGALRVSFHLYNTEDDVDAALAALGGERRAVGP